MTTVVNTLEELREAFRVQKLFDQCELSHSYPSGFGDECVSCQHYRAVVRNRVRKFRSKTKGEVK